MQTFTLARLGETKLSTWGELRDPGGKLLCDMLERGAHNPDHPRIPAGTYTLALRTLGESKFDVTLKNHPVPGYRGIIQVLGVPGRSAIEIHPANRFAELEGCLATGGRIEGDRDGNFFITGGTSRTAFAHAYPVIAKAIDAEGAQLTIKDIGQ